MGKISRSSKLLKEINNLEQNCSDTEYDESDLVESENEYPSSNSESPSESSDTDSEDEIDVCVEKVKESKFLKVKVIRMLKMSVIDRDTEISVDGTMWKKTARGLNTRKITSTQHFQRKCQVQRHTRNDIL